jgi:hypothetical protein
MPLPAPVPQGRRPGWPWAHARARAWAWAGWLGVGLLLGCQTPRTGETGSSAIPGPASPSPSTNAVPALRPLGGAAGLIVQVQPALRFVVVDFSLNQLPGAGQVLSVYRAGEVVGSVKAGRVQRGSSLAADILSGELQVGDEVRPE